MSLTLYHLKNCDSCKKAIKALEQSGNQLSLIDVRADGIDRKQLETLAKSQGYETLLNTRSTTWRNLNEDEKSDLDFEKAISLMMTHPTLIKRPVITDGSKTTIGWSPASQKAWL